MQRPGSPSSFVELASGHSPAWDATERQMATEDREMKEFIARNRREIAALTEDREMKEFIARNRREIA